MAEYRAHDVITLPDVHEHWFLWASRTTVPAPVLSKAGSFGWVHHHQDGVRDYVYVRHGVRTAEVGS